MPAVPCPTCHGEVPVGEAEDGDWIRCPHCESGVKARRGRVAAPVLTLRPPNPNRQIIPVLWAFLAAAGVGLLICGGIGLAVYDIFTDPEFKPYTSGEGRFACEFPGTPYRCNPQTFAVDGPSAFPAVVYERSMPDDAYMIAWMDVPPERLTAGADAILADSVNGITAHNRYVLGEVSRTPITLDKHPGMEVITSTRGSDGKGIVRVYLVRERLYVVIVAGGFIQPDSKRAKHFLNSFKVW